MGTTTVTTDSNGDTTVVQETVTQNPDGSTTTFTETTDNDGSTSSVQVTVTENVDGSTTTVTETTDADGSTTVTETTSGGASAVTSSTENSLLHNLPVPLPVAIGAVGAVIIGGLVCYMKGKQNNSKVINRVTAGMEMDPV